MAKIPEALRRMFMNVFVCRNCSTKIRAEPRKVLEGKIKCRKCKGHIFRPIRKK